MGALLMPRSSVVQLDRGMFALLDLTLQARFELALRYAITRYWSNVVAFAILSALMTLEGRSFYAVLMRSLASLHDELR